MCIRDRTITVTQTEAKISLTVHDWGSVISPEHIKKVFDPFFTTKEPDKGTGLGLLITRDIIKQNFHGKIMVKSDKKQGTFFTITIPKTYPKVKPA